MRKQSPEAASGSSQWISEGKGNSALVSQSFLEIHLGFCKLKFMPWGRQFDSLQTKWILIIRDN